MNFKKQRSKHLGILLIFTPIPLTPKKCGLAIGYKGRIWEWHTLTYTILQWYFSSIKFCTFFPLYLTNYLIGLTFWAFPIGLSVWLGVGSKGTNKTLAPIGLGLFCLNSWQVQSYHLLYLIPLYKYSCTLGLIYKLYLKTLSYMQPLHKIFVVIQSH